MNPDQKGHRKQKTPPLVLAGFLKAFAVDSCKVGGDGITSAVTCEILLEDPDERQA